MDSSDKRRHDPAWILFCYGDGGLFGERGRPRVLALADACAKIEHRRDFCLRSAEAHAARDPGSDQEGAIALMACAARIRATLYTIVLECLVAEIRARDKAVRAHRALGHVLLGRRLPSPMNGFLLNIEDAAREVAVGRFIPPDAAFPDLDEEQPTSLHSLHRLRQELTRIFVHDPNAIARAWVSLDIAIELLTQAFETPEGDADPKEWGRFTYGVIRQDPSA